MSDNIEGVKSARTLVLCFDGTANEYDGDNTNVVKFFSFLKKDDFSEQLCYYQAGIGTFFSPGVVSPIFHWVARVLDYAVAWYLDAHVMNGYRFLMQNYRAGDKVCIFGFSRGAYTARALGGMLFKVGLLPRDNPEQITFAYKLFQRTDDVGVRLSAGFKQTFCRDVKVEFMGVWDTVSSVGLVMGRTLPFTNSNKSIKTFRHALALDERRSRFRPNCYHRPAPSMAAAAFDPEHASHAPATVSVPSDSSCTESEDLKPKIGSKRQSFFKSKLRRQKQFHTAAEEEGDDTDVLEVWFSGCHQDVGGGGVADGDNLDLSEITLRWMVRQVISSQCGILFDQAALIRASIPDHTFPTALSTEAGSEELVLDRVDALQPIRDQIKKVPLWWLLEIVPMHYSWQDGEGVWHKDYGFHMAKGRVIHDKNPKFHVTVKQRMADASLKYRPRAKWNHGSEVYVE